MRTGKTCNNTVPVDIFEIFTLSMPKLSSTPLLSRLVYTRTVSLPSTASASHVTGTDCSFQLVALPPHSLVPWVPTKVWLQHASPFTLMYAFSLSLWLDKAHLTSRDLRATHAQYSNRYHQRTIDSLVGWLVSWLVGWLIDQPIALHEKCKRGARTTNRS